jgi:hypothetical protein
MTTKKDVLGLVDAGRKVRRPALVGMQSLHQGAMRAPDVLGTRAGLKAKDLLGLLLRHWPTARRPALPRCRISLRVLTPAGRPAVKIRCQ